MPAHQKNCNISSLLSIKMLDISSTSAPFQRSKGRARVVIGPVGITELAQSGSAKAILPRIMAGPPEITFLNTSGGLASGDKLEFEVELRAGVYGMATTQTAERVYRAEGPSAQAHVSLKVGKEGWLDWLPQETILFNGAHLSRVTEVDLAQGAGCILLETIIMGRLAMGETLTRLNLSDRRIVRLAGHIIHHDALVLGDAALSRLGDPSMLGDARAIATLTMISASAPDFLPRARKILDEPGVTGAASAPPGRLIIRLMAKNSWLLRKQINRLLLELRPHPLPRVWQV